MAAAYRATRRAAARRRAGSLQRREHRAHRGGAARGAPVPERERHRADPPQGGQDPLGTQRYVEWTQYERVAEAAEAAHTDGFAIVGLELADESVPFFELDLAGDVCIALGNESNGLNATALACCDAVGYIPQLGRVGSLNVAAATAVALYETRRQGWQEG